MKKILLSAYIVTWVLLLSACGGGSKTSSLQAEGDTVRMKYSSLLQIVKHADYTVVTIRNPWDTLKVLHTYLLADREKPLPEHLPEGTVVRTPLQKSVIYSSVHCSLWSELDELKGIGGVCGLEYIKLPQIQEGCRNGSIVNVGNSMNPDIERIIDLRPDAILLSPFENSGGYGRVGKLNIPIIECADYMETSALGRAEWMRLYGLLLGKEAQADSLFAGIEKEYLTLTGKIAEPQTADGDQRNEKQLCMVHSGRKQHYGPPLSGRRSRLCLCLPVQQRICTSGFRNGIRPGRKCRHLADQIQSASGQDLQRAGKRLCSLRTLQGISGQKSIRLQHQPCSFL